MGRSAVRPRPSAYPHCSLGGSPKITAGDTNIGLTVIDQLRNDLAIQNAVVPALNDAIALCREHHDAGTASMLEALLVGEDEHTDWLETQLELIEQIGQERYLAQQLAPAAA